MKKLRLLLLATTLTFAVMPQAEAYVCPECDWQDHDPEEDPDENCTKTETYWTLYLGFIPIKKEREVPC